MGQKYDFIKDETLNWNGHVLHRIYYHYDFDHNCKQGGWIESKYNLSQEGECRVSDNAKVYGNARICGKARVCDDAEVYDNAIVSDSGFVADNAKVYGNAQLHGVSRVACNAQVYGNAEINGDDYVWIGDNARVYGEAKVYGTSTIEGNARVYDDAEIFNEAYVGGNAKIAGDTKIYGNAKIISGDYNSGDYYENENDLLEDSEAKEVVQDFIYKVDDSNKLTTQTEYNSINEFFDTSIADDIKLDTLVICTVDTKEPLIKLQKVKADNRAEFKFIVDITNEDDDDFRFRSVIKSQEQLGQLIQQTVDALKQYPKFSKYANDLEECL